MDRQIVLLIYRISLHNHEFENAGHLERRRVAISLSIFVPNVHSAGHRYVQLATDACPHCGRSALRQGRLRAVISGDTERPQHDSPLWSASEHVEPH